MDLAEFDKRTMPEPNSGCLLWIGAADTGKYGHGHLWLNGKCVAAHKVAYERSRGPVPEGLEIDHLCRTPCCVNPDHLEAVTKRVNILRGVGPTAINAKKSFCCRGHRLEGGNLMLGKSGRRDCRTCHRERSNRAMKKYAQLHPERCREAKRRWHHANKKAV